MAARRPPAWFFLLVAALGLTGCEPYMSMTDRIPAQTRQATSLLPEAPRYAGMVDLETVMGQVDEFRNLNLADSLRQTNNARLQAFLSATGMDPETDLKAVYGAIGDGSSFSAVVFADLTPDQMDRYLDRAPDGSGRATTYRDVPVYRLHTGRRIAEEEEVPDTLSLAFVDSGTIAAATDAEAVEGMVDRHHSETGGLRSNDPYMTLVERVGHGSTAWLVGRDVLQTAFRDTAASPSRVEVSEAGFERFLSSWADRVLGVSETPPALDGSTGGKVEQLERRIREQAVSLTLTDDALEGEVYLTMRDAESAVNVVDVSKGAMAAIRLSDKEMDGLAGDLLDGISIDRNGPVVHVQFGVARERLRQTVQKTREGHTAHRAKPLIRQSKQTIRRLGGILGSAPALGTVHKVERACNLCADRPVSHTG